MTGLLLATKAIGSRLKRPGDSAIMRISIEAAQNQLPRLIEVASCGEEVVLSRGDVPVARIVPIATSTFRIGVLPQSALGPGPDWFEPMSEAELAVWERER